MGRSRSPVDRALHVHSPGIGTSRVPGQISGGLHCYTWRLDCLRRRSWTFAHRGSRNPSRNVHFRHRPVGCAVCDSFTSQLRIRRAAGISAAIHRTACDVRHAQGDLRSCAPVAVEVLRSRPGRTTCNARNQRRSGHQRNVHIDAGEPVPRRLPYIRNPGRNLPPGMATGAGHFRFLPSDRVRSLAIPQSSAHRLSRSTQADRPNERLSPGIHFRNADHPGIRSGEESQPAI